MSNQLIKMFYQYALDNRIQVDKQMNWKVTTIILMHEKCRTIQLCRARSRVATIGHPNLHHGVPFISIDCTILLLYLDCALYALRCEVQTIEEMDQ